MTRGILSIGLARDRQGVIAMTKMSGFGRNASSHPDNDVVRVRQHAAGSTLSGISRGMQEESAAVSDHGAPALGVRGPGVLDGTPEEER